MKRQENETCIFRYGARRNNGLNKRGWWRMDPLWLNMLCRKPQAQVNDANENRDAGRFQRGAPISFYCEKRDGKNWKNQTGFLA